MKILALVSLGEWNSLGAVPASELPLVQRVREFSAATGSVVHFRHEVFDPALNQDDDSTRALRERLLEDERAWLNELEGSFAEEGITAACTVEFVRTRIDSLLETIEAEQPDLVFKISRDHNFLLGLFTHLDWELIRRSPVPVWFVKQQLPDIRKIVTAIDFVSESHDAQTKTHEQLDHSVFSHARQLAEMIPADLSVIHAYESSGWFEPLQLGVTADAGFAASPDTQRMLADMHRERDEQAKTEHAIAMGGLCRDFDFPPERVLLRRGSPATVITQAASELQAGVIIMGATSLPRWERVFSITHAEPVLADSNCDVVFIPERAPVLPGTSGLKADLTQLDVADDEGMTLDDDRG